jgi:hypothetical protein
MEDVQEADTVASIQDQLECMTPEDQAHLAKEMGVNEDFPSA